MSHRRPYALRSDDSVNFDEDDDEALDEEHQENLINNLATSDAENSTLYRRIFVLVPLLATLPFIFTLFSFGASNGVRARSRAEAAIAKRDRLLALLSISSLLCTAWWLWYCPYNSKSKDVLGVGKLSSLTSSTFANGEGKDRKGKTRWWQEQAGSVGDARGPLEKYLGLMNAGLAFLLLGTAFLMAGRADEGLFAAGSDGGAGALRVWRWGVPALVFVLTAVVRQQLAPLDLEDLQRARYEYKGA